MSERQLSVMLDSKFKSRLKKEAGKRGLSVSQIARAILTEGIERIDGVYVIVDRAILERILATIIGIEEMVVRDFFANVLPQIADEKERVKILESIDPNARKKSKDLLDGAKRGVKKVLAGLQDVRPLHGDAQVLGQDSFVSHARMQPGFRSVLVRERPGSHGASHITDEADGSTKRRFKERYPQGSWSAFR